jgi:hypothetical protein
MIKDAIIVILMLAMIAVCVIDEKHKHNILNSAKETVLLN